jgi:hypothetical protein
MRGPISQKIFLGAMFCVLAALPAAGATTDQTRKNKPAKSQVILVNGNSVIVIRNGRVQTKTIRRSTTVMNQIHAPKAAAALKDMPIVKGDAEPCIKLVRDTSGYYGTPYYRARNDCSRRVRLWVFDTSRKLWLNSIIVESREDATSDEYDGIPVGADQVVAACTMSGDTTPPGCFPKISDGLYAIASNNVILR